MKYYLRPYCNPLTSTGCAHFENEGFCVAMSSDIAEKQFTRGA